MKKIVNFIVEKRYIMLLVFILSAILSVYLSTKVNLNYEITNYLPKDSNVKKGIDIMNTEFDSGNSSFKIMFSNLNDKEKDNIYHELLGIKNVVDVSYDHSEKYNKDNYTLYEITTKGDKDSSTASEAYQSIVDKYENYEFETNGDVATRNKDVMPIYILAAAVLCGTIILIIMCDSVVEVFLFLFTILIAVLLNKGTNVFFPSVSNITDSISAILQLALSMDYSIILMNRFNQEKSKFKTKKEAMKSALYQSIGSIASSSLTTVVGLLALIFMSFTIGRDLGFVLAKGVLCSLISTFFVLPGLILIFDKGIEKTHKKSPHINMNFISKISYRGRYIFLVIFIALFVTSYFLKGNLDIYYTDTKSDPISEVFNTNQMAIIYNNRDETKVSEYCQKLANDERVLSALCLGNTLDEDLKYNEISPKLKELGFETNLEDYILKLAYYNYFNKDNNKITINDFIAFINNVVYPNKDLNIPSNMKEDIKQLSYFSSKQSLNKERSSKEIANILGINEKLVNDLLIYYNSTQDTKLTLKEFIVFMNKSVINNNEYNIPEDLKESIKALSLIINNVDNKFTPSELSTILNIPTNDLEQIYLLASTMNDTTTKLSINTFTTIILNNYQKYPDKFETNLINNVRLVNTFSDYNLINTELNSSTLSSLLSIPEPTVTMILTNSGKTSSNISDFINILLNSGLITNNEEIIKLNTILNIINLSKNKETYSYQEMSSILNIDTDLTKTIYSMYDSTNLKLSIREVITIIKTNNLVNNPQIDQIYAIINNLDTKLSSNELKQVLNINSDDISLIYGLYNYQTNKTISLNHLISFINKNVINNKTYSSYFNDTIKSKLQGLQGIVNAVNNNQKLTSTEMIKLFKNIEKDINTNAIKIVYLYYGSVYQYNNEWQLNLKTLVNYLNKDVITNPTFKEYLTEDTIKLVSDAKIKLSDAEGLLVGKNYSRLVIETNLPVESKETRHFIKEIENNLDETEFYIVGNSAMSYEMNNTFNDELNLITILTMLFIFVVVAITFRSIIIPIILVLTIQCAVFTTMGILSIFSGDVYFISLLIVQAVLMGATIDYAIVYTTYYLENRRNFNVKEAIKEAYNKSVHTIITSSCILCICTLIVAIFTNAASSRICETISEGALCATILIVFVLPGVLGSVDKIIRKKRK